MSDPVKTFLLSHRYWTVIKEGSYEMTIACLSVRPSVWSFPRDLLTCLFKYLLSDSRRLKN